jgi:UDP-N-acetylmuramoylalanine--D-glutamate ligase
MDSSSTNGAVDNAQFRGKKITVMGLGLLGRGLGDARFLAAAGADLIITDLKTEAELAPSIAALADVRGPDGAPAKIVYHLGGHRLEDFADRDLILRAPNAPLDSPFLARARELGIPVKMDASLFVELCPDEVTIVGITGTRGKSTTTHLIYEMARAAFSGAGRKVYLGGNERDIATLPLIEKVAAGDIVILELDSWQLQGFEESRVSPDIAVWTNFMPDHMNYYHGDMDRYFADKAAIARFQRAGSGDSFVAPREIKERVEKTFFAGAALPGNWIAPADLSSGATSDGVLGAGWEIALPGEHNRANAACAVSAARVLGISDEIIKKVLKTFAGLPGRLEFLGEKNGVVFYNDSNSTTPDATIAALRALADRPVVLIAGGNDKELDFAILARELADLQVKKSLKALVLFEGKASEKLKALLPADFPAPTMAATMAVAFEAARAAAASGDIILLSPGATSFGIFKNEYDRGDQFREAVEDL